MTAPLLVALVGLALLGLWLVRCARRAASSDRVSVQTLARLRQAQEEDA